MSTQYASLRPLPVLLLATLLLTACESFGPSATRPSPAPTPASGAAAVVSPQTGEKRSQPAAAAASTPEGQFQEAVKLMQARDYAKAEPLLLELTRSQPKFSGPYANLGILYARSNRPQPALQALQQAISLNPRNADAQNQIGILLRQSGQLQAAEKAYLAALSAAPDQANAHLNLALLYDVYLKQPAQALPHYEQYQRLAPDDAARVAVWIANLKQRMQKSP